MLTLHDGRRDRVLAVARAVDSRGRRRYHLDIKLDTLVTKVNLDDCLRATGVSYLEGKSLYRADPRSPAAGAGNPGSANATREVIIAGGTFNTPQILQLSGIGPRDELERLGIPVRANLPGVGRNLRDVSNNLLFFIIPPRTNLLTLDDGSTSRWPSSARPLPTSPSPRTAPF